MSDYNELTVADLKALLEKKGLPKTGKKAELIARLEEHDSKPVEKPKARPKGRPKKIVVPEEEIVEEVEAVEEVVQKPKAKSKGRPKKAKVQVVNRSRSKSPPKTKVPSRSRSKSPPKTPTESASESPVKAKPKRGRSKSPAKARNQSPARSRSRTPPRVELFADSIPGEYAGKSFYVSSEQLYAALKSSQGMTGIFFSSIASHVEVKIQPQWNEAVGHFVDNNGYAYDTTRMVIGKVEGDKIVKLSGPDITFLESRRILYFLEPEKPKATETKLSSKSSESTSESVIEDEQNEGEEEGEEIVEQRPSTIDRFSAQIKKTFKETVERKIQQPVVQIPKGPALNERDQTIYDIIKPRKAVGSSILLKLVQRTVADATLDDINRIKKML